MVQPAGRAQNAVWVPLAYSRDYARRGIEHLTDSTPQCASSMVRT
jgi:hypothetical protein